MTEYGRGYGSEPWHPDDPLYGDQGRYGGQPRQPQQGPYGEQYDGPQQQNAYGGQQQGGQQHGGHGGQQHGGHGGQQHDGHGGQQQPYGQQPQGRQWDELSGPYPPAQQQYGGGWDASQGGAPYDPYGQHPPVDPYSGQSPDYYGTQDAYPPPQPQHLRQQQAGQPGPHGQAGQSGPQGQPGPHEQSGPHGQSVPQGPHGPQGQGEQGDQIAQTAQFEAVRPEHLNQPPHPSPPGDDFRAAPGPEQDEQVRDPAHSFFKDDRDGDDGYDDDTDPREERRAGRERRGRKSKQRSRMACLIVAGVFVVGGGGVAYFGYDFWQSHFGSAPDFEGEGSGDVQVQIPSGASLLKMGLILKEAGVVKSADAFTEAASDKQLQAGAYSLRKQMSAASAVQLMLDPKSRNGLTVREGLRNGAVYDLIDKKLHLTSGTTKDVAAAQLKNLGLPSWANSNPKIKDPLEGFLYPSTYSVSGKAKPEDVLKEMVARANREYAKYDLEENARKLELKSPLDLITVASLTQAEGITHDDFRKMAAVVYNRLAPSNTITNQKLEFDSTYNYLKNQSKIDISTREIRNYDDPYNTYFYKGLPPGPIGNPGEDALKASIDPDQSAKWLFFISIDGKKTDFTTNLKDHEKLVAEFNKRKR
ncbi:membrane protein [Streptomyces chrestomyceticus JCM 4735]|uniref:Endolytic murein transglycosylase n=1 Tax=Streptomyces chrestomyceticus JCM 4735 TaxID=1306181 RepID=A0A7U9Q245_9ACTN|nr:endolytic transglycosylase MltG [Streptomyces chrestomyceticus]GCD39085.1 membrane protein [Streptomyces chrestomyceticus JCM 4735]